MEEIYRWLLLQLLLIGLLRVKLQKLRIKGSVDLAWLSARLGLWNQLT